MAILPCFSSAFSNQARASGPVSLRIAAPRGGHFLPVSTVKPMAVSREVLPSIEEEEEATPAAGGALGVLNAETEAMREQSRAATFMVVGRVCAAQMGKGKGEQERAEGAD